MGTIIITQQPNSTDTFLYPIKTGCTDGSECSGCSYNWQCTDDNKDTIDIEDFIWTDSVPTIRTYVMPQKNIKPYTDINYIKLCYVIKSKDYGLAYNARVQSTVSFPDKGMPSAYDGLNFNLITGYRTYTETMFKNPRNGKDWDWLDFKDMHFGLVLSSPSIQLHTFIFRPFMDGDIDIESSYPSGTEHWEAVKSASEYKFIQESRATPHEDTFYVSLPSEKQLTYFDTTDINNWSNDNLVDGVKTTWSLAGDNEVCTMNHLDMKLNLHNLIAPVENVRMRAYIAPANLYAPAIGCATYYDKTENSTNGWNGNSEGDINMAAGIVVASFEGTGGYQPCTVLYGMNFPSTKLYVKDVLNWGRTSCGLIGSDYVLIGGNYVLPKLYDISSGTFHYEMSFPTSDYHEVGSGGWCHVCRFDGLIKNFHVIGEYIVTSSLCCGAPETKRIHVWKFNSSGTTPETKFEYITRYDSDLGTTDCAYYYNDPTKILIHGDRVLVFDTVAETISQVSDTDLYNAGDQWSDGRYIWDREGKGAFGTPFDVNIHVWEVSLEDSTVTHVDKKGEDEGWYYKAAVAYRAPITMHGIPCGDCVVGLQHTKNDGEGDNILYDVLYLGNDRKIHKRCRVSLPSDRYKANPILTNGYTVWTWECFHDVVAYNVINSFATIPEEQMDCDSAPTGEFTLQPYIPDEGYGLANTTTDLHLGWTDWIDLSADPKAPAYWDFNKLRKLGAKVLGTNAACAMVQVELDQDYTIECNEIKLFARMRNEFDCDGNEYGYFVISHPTNGDFSTGSTPLNLGFPAISYSTSVVSLPDGSAPWTLHDIQNSKFGIGLRGDECKAICEYFYITAEYHVPFSPEIHCAAMHVKVNHTPEEVECEINKPETVSFDHARNVKMINFWSGNRAVYDLNRSGKSLVLKGLEFDIDMTGCKQPSQCSYPERDACERLKCIDDMGRDGNPITITGFAFSPWNKQYRIMSFGYKKIQECPALFEYILELEAME